MDDDDTAVIEVAPPCPTCYGTREVVHQWHDGTAAVSPCPTCVGPAGGYQYAPADDGNPCLLHGGVMTPAGRKDTTRENT